ncbi:putative gustatory receptor 28a [Drosophila innubila]|uniref:putative gustatory receptor 28a n=1 Tax=Drosophila innubila TaxID=198719 RepID=UPI00148CA524|nr:putative gustatory receptor 28a [Drosophila innubila]
MHIMLLIYICITRLVKRRFSMINEILQDILDAYKAHNTVLEISSMHTVVNVTSIVRQVPENAIKHVSTIQNLLCDVCQTIDEYLSYNLLIVITVLGCNTVFEYYSLKSAKTFDITEFNFFIIEVAFSILLIFLVVEVGSSTISKISTTTDIVPKILNITDDLEVRDRLFRLSTQLTLRKVRFTISELFKLDRSLLVAIIGSVAYFIYKIDSQVLN